MPVVNVQAEELSKRSFLHLALEPGVAPVPCGLVVGQQQNTVSAGKRSHSLRILQACSQWFFHHYVNPPRCAGFHHRQVLLDGAVGKHRLRMRLVQHGFQVREEQLLGDPAAQGIVVQVSSIFFPYTHHLDFSALKGRYHPSQVVMRNTRDTDPKRLRKKQDSQVDK